LCFAKTPNIKPAPAPPTFDKAVADEDILARDNTRKRLRGAMNTRTSLLDEYSSQLNQAGGETGKKTLLGQ